MGSFKANADWIVSGLALFSAAIGLVQALIYQRVTGRKWSLRQSYYLMLATEMVWIGRWIAFVGGIILISAAYDQMVGDGLKYGPSSMLLLTLVVVVGVLVSVVAQRWKRKKMTF